ncbi:MAG: DsrE family protein [Burkholderiales bacterium]|nr:DsrE family protein [Burkholderiales bacterium]
MLASIKSLAIAGVAAGLLGLGGCASTGDTSAKSTDPIKTVYHINDSTVAGVAMNNIKNHMSADPGGKITVVTHGKGIDFLLDGAADKNGNPYNIAVEELMAKGVDFRVCNNTLVGRKIDPKTVLPGAKIVPSGVAELGKLQSGQGYVYIKP